METEIPAWVSQVSARLRAARQAAGLSVRDAGEAAGVSPSTVQRSEAADKHGPPLPVLARLAAAYGVQPADLLPPLPG